MPATVLVTGATGFIGACLVHKISKIDNVHIILRKESNIWRIKDIINDLNVHYADLTNLPVVQKIVQKIKPDIIYHLAAYGTYSSQDDCSKIIQTNIAGTLNLLKACEQAGFSVFINTGTSSEYGTKNKPMVESDITEPNTCYGVSKVSQTLLCQHFAREKKLPIITLRIFSAYGPYEGPTRLIPQLISSCLEGKDLTLAAPETARDFVFIDDIIDVYLKIAEKPELGGEIFNIGSGKQTTLQDLVSAVIKLTEAKVKQNWNVMPDRSFDTTTWVADISKIKKIIKGYPKYNLEEGLQKTIDWLSNNQEILKEKYAIR
jgi:nucleoside-diphosphate-sugar epimerase